MRSKCLKNVLAGLVIAGLSGWMISCPDGFNPFSNNLGEKVDVEPPVVKDITPVSGALLKDEVTFTGQATAYRELKSVEVKIFNPEDKTKFLGPREWTPVDTITGSDSKQKTWTFTLKTMDEETREYYNYTDSAGNERSGLEDGFLRIQFRASDPNFTGDKASKTVELVYIIKNGPSVIKMTMPSSNDLVDKDGIPYITTKDWEGKERRSLEPNGEILGNIIDRRGIKPDYPRIKFWPANIPEPADEDTNWGWAVLFLRGIDNYDEGVDFYRDRTTRPVENVGNFAFKLAQYTIDPVTRHIIYQRTGADFVPLETREYKFKIETKDTFFEEDINSANYRRPREPGDGEWESTAYSPDNPDDVYLISVKKSEAKPNIDLDNEDITERGTVPMPAEPHIYMTQSTAKKIVVPEALANTRKDFRLRIRAYNPDLIIERATLEWRHDASGRSGYLPWDNVYDDPDLNDPNSNEGYYDSSDPTNRHETDSGEGHRGAWRNFLNPAEGKIFQFTAKNGVPYKNLLDNDQFFTGSTEPYTLTVTVWPTGTSSPTEQPYTLYLDGTGPEVSIYEVKGAFSGPEGDPAETIGGTINDKSYTVNGNIQVAIDRSANMGIGQVKWAVELAADTEDGTAAGLYANTNSLYHKLRNFRDEPTKPDATAFFDNLETTMPAGTSGLITEFENRKYNFKLNVSGWDGEEHRWDGKDVWLYIIAQDGVYNLGYTVQKLHVDESTDIPLLTIAGLAASTGDGAIANAADLYITVVGDNNIPDKDKANVLNSGQGIELYLFDDDGIQPSEVAITLTSHNIGKTETFNAVDMIGDDDVLREKNTILPQAIMAKALYDNPATEINEAPGELPDGVYTINIKVNDHLGSKISGDGLSFTPVSVPNDPNGKTIHFVVYSQGPQIEVLNPGVENSMQTAGNVEVHGTVKSRLKIQKLDITFTPDIVSDPPTTGSWNGLLTLYTKADYSEEVGTAAGAWKTATPNDDGDYIYYWKKTVNFAPEGLAGEGRFFNVRTWDGLGEPGVAERNVQIDRDPPTVALLAFNFNRLDYNGENIVNGKVPIEIDAFDLNGIGPERDTDYVQKDADEVSIQWFVVPAGDIAPTWVLNSAGWDAANAGNKRAGQFTHGDNRGGGRYRVVLDTTLPAPDGMTAGKYDLYVIAEDTAGNCSVDPSADPPRLATPLITFEIDQAKDIPLIREDDMEPKHGLGYTLGGQAELVITGSIYDDDGFDPKKKDSYVKIRFPASITNIGNWGAWKPVPAEIDEHTGYLKYTFPLASDPYFNGDGAKYYQLWIQDEKERGDGPDAQGNYKPEGKNPDGKDTIGVAHIYQPGNLSAARPINSVIDDTTAYCFTLKNTDPVVFFNSHDPTEGHPNYNSVRPTYTTAAGLAAALGGTIEEISLREPVIFTYGNLGVMHELYTAENAPQGITPHLTKGNLNDNNVQIYNWTLDTAWLAGFDPAGQGMNSITIRAYDTIGNYTIAEWSFYKDTEPPEISFDNISAGNATMTISGDVGAVFVTGQFNDTYSNIAASFGYKLYKRGTTVPANFTPQDITWEPNASKQSATWRVAIPGTFTDDGPYLFQIQVSDMGGNRWAIGTNETITVNNVGKPTGAPIEFVVDRRTPEMIAAASMRVSGNGLVNASGTAINGPLAENQRVFSAASAASGNTTSVFTLSGIVYEHNLNVLTANIRNRSTTVVPVTLANINASAVAWKNGGTVTASYGNGTGANNLTNANFRVKRATTTDLTNFGVTGTDVTVNYRYVWELDIRQGDFYRLMHETDIGVNDDAATRSILVTARDLVPNDSIEQVWQFWLDSKKPKITFSNVNDNGNLDSNGLGTNPAGTVTKWTTLENQPVTLSGTVEDSTNIRSIEYKIEKYNYDAATPAWVTQGTEWRPYAFTGTNNSLVTWTLDNTITGRTFTAAGNTTSNTNPIGGNAVTRQFTFANHGLVVGDTVSVSGTNRYVIYVSGNNFKLSNTYTWPTDNAVWNPAAGNIEVTTLAFANEGRYRLSIRAADYSLSSTAGGNQTAATDYVREFYIDRTEPAITWTTQPQNFHRWDNTNKIVFNLNVTDINTLDNANASTATAAMRGVLREFDTGDEKSRPTATAGYVTVTLNAPDANKTAGTVTVTIDKNSVDLPNRRYTLTLTIKDKAGHQASVNQTINFFLDNTAPIITVDPVANLEALTGRVMFRGTFTKNNPNSPVRRVAYSVHAAAPAHTNANGEVMTDAQLATNGWRFNDGSGSATYKLTNGTGNNAVDLMEINQGLGVANLLLYDTRRFIGLTGDIVGAGSKIGGWGAGQNVSAAGAVTFNGTAISPGTEQVHKLTIHLLAIDEAGNSTVTPFSYWVYPAGDYPHVTAITNPGETDTEVNRQLNGTIRISGTATDNYRVQRVWFRVLKDGQSGTTDGHTGYMPATDLIIPVWDERGNATSANQAVNGGTTAAPVAALIRNGTNYGTGWYIASGSGPGTISWYAQINTRGELDPSGDATSRGIIIQTMVEDTIWVDSMNSNNGGYAATGLMSQPATAGKFHSKEVQAWVVSGAPIFEDERILVGSHSGANPDVSGWGTIYETAVSSLATYSVTVKHNSGVGSIRWTNGDTVKVTGASAINLLGLTGTTTAGTIGDGTTGDGIHVRAQPKAPITNTTLAAGTYMVWTWGSGLAGIGGLPASGATPAPTTENMRYTTFTLDSANSTNIGTTAEVLRRTADGYYEWIVLVDIDTRKLFGYTGDVATYFPMSFEAAEISKSSPLISRQNSRIPIDKLPPSGVYTHTTNVVGTNPTFGGDAGDAAGEVTGLSRVVMWFSRSISGTETSIVWDELAHASAAPERVFNNGITTSTGAEPTGIAGLPSNITLPLIPFNNFTGTANNSCIVIDRHDPLRNQTHHGHRLAMSWQKTGNSSLDTSWDVVLDSTLIESGRVTAHYIVYDRAGNGTYYSQKLMILNSIPKISSITLATDLYGQYSPLNLQNTLENNTVTNLTYGATGALAAGKTGSAINTIRTQYTTAGLTTAADPDAVKGISTIPIDTSKPGVYSVVFDQPNFMVRNNLLAVKVDTIVGQTSTEKERSYRVEYVSNAATKTGTDVLTAQNTGIRAGRVYIINNPGINQFPWGVLGAQGETYQRGMVFLAIQDGYDLDATVRNGNYGTGNNAPSVWELNSSYYTNDTYGLTRNVASANLQFTGGSDVKYRKVGDNSWAGPGTSAEFVYRTTAFATAGSATETTTTTQIRNFTAGTNNLDAMGRPLPYPAGLPAAQTTAYSPWLPHSLFIVKVFDGDESDLFGDFALLSIRVNNNDVTPPYVQLYDLNPNTEGLKTARTQAEALAPENMGSNRAKGGLYNTGTTSSVAKSGHIEPRKQTSLTGPEMGGASGSGSITAPAVTTSAYFDYDTVSGEVIVRGYAEDNQRIARVDLEFYAEPAGTDPLSRVTILTRDKTTTGPTAAALLKPAPTRVVQFKETVDLDRHRVEWAYLWNSETIPGGANVVGNLNVRAVAYNANTAIIETGTGDDPINNERTITAAPRVHTSTRITRSGTTAQTTYDSFNLDFPASGTSAAGAGPYIRYNDTRVNLRPYITGFLRNSAQFSHNTRSRQGRYMFARGEVVVASGFNLLNNSGNTNIILPGTGTNRVSITTATVGTIGNYGIATANNIRYRQFTIPTTASGTTGAVASGTGLVTLTVNNFSAVNTPTPVATATAETAATLRPMVSSRPVVQPWNKEYNAAVDGSQLWDDFITLHIWQSNDETAANNDQGRFKRSDNAAILITYPSMSIDPATGTLWESHNEGGGNGGNTGTTKVSNNWYNPGYTNTTNPTNNNANAMVVAAFLDPIVDSDIYISPRASDYNDMNYSVWTTYSLIGRGGNSGQNSLWRNMGGLFISGPQGSAMAGTAFDNMTQQNSGVAIAGNNNNTANHYGFGNNTPAYHSARSQYIAESTVYNGTYDNVNPPKMSAATISYRADPLSLNQFRNPHIVTAYNGGNEHIHVAYYDTLTQSIKYRYNRRNAPGVVYGDGTSGTSATSYMTAANNPVYGWTNLDGGWDPEDTFALTATDPFTAVAANARIVGYGNPTGFTNYRNTALPTGLTTPSATVAGSRNVIANRNNTGEHNAIAVDRNGYPVIAYYDATQQRLKLAVSRSTTPFAATNWTIRDYVIPSTNTLSTGTGQYVSLRIDTSGNNNIVHIAALNATGKQVVYIRGTLNPTSGTTGTYGLYQSSGGVLTDVTVQVVDSVGSVGAWTKISLDSAGNPWIAYQDESWLGSRDGVKVAFLSTDTFYKGAAGTTFAGEDMDVHGNNITGWEAMHVPTQFRVRNSRLGMENFPTRNVTTTATKFWKGAVGYLSEDYFRIAYYVE
jgi:hypothetical protein